MKQLAASLYHFARLIAGWAAFLVTKRTPAFAYHSMISLFCRTRGVSNELMSSIIGFASRPYAIPSASGIAGPLAPGDAERIARDIGDKGYHVFAERIPAEVCRQLVERAERMPARLLSAEKDDAPAAPFDPARAKGAAYDCVNEHVLADEAVQAIIADESLLAVAQAYLRTSPILSHVNLRWSTARENPDVEAAQYFHFDMDRIKWLEFFIYLTDVDEHTGPHQFVVGSHVPRGIPDELLSHGYTRLSDALVFASYPPERFIEFTGPAGTIIAEDTRGLHKRTALTSGRRLMLNFELANSLFGNPYERLPLPARASAQFEQAASRYPGVFTLFAAR